MTIADVLIPKLQQRFVDRGLKITDKLQPCAIFTSPHPEVGDIEIHDDGDELTLVAGMFSHGHFSNYDDELTTEQKADVISNDIIEFLDDVFADRVVFWGTHQSAGGWYQRDEEGGHSQSVWRIAGKDAVTKRVEYVWSGPLPTRPKQTMTQRFANFLRGRKT